jgi:DNA-binding NtrC family response regulator
LNQFVVVIDGNPTELDLTVTVLRLAGFKVEGFPRAKAALEFARRTATAVIVTEVFIPEMDGIEVLRFIRRELPSIGVIGIGGSTDGLGTNYLAAMTALGATEIIPKPVDAGALVAAVTRVFQKRQITTPGGEVA